MVYPINIPLVTVFHSYQYLPIRKHRMGPPLDSVQLPYKWLIPMVYDYSIHGCFFFFFNLINHSYKTKLRSINYSYIYLVFLGVSWFIYQHAHHWAVDVISPERSQEVSDRTNPPSRGDTEQERPWITNWVINSMNYPSLMWICDGLVS